MLFSLILIISFTAAWSQYNVHWYDVSNSSDTNYQGDDSLMSKGAIFRLAKSVAQIYGTGIESLSSIPDVSITDAESSDMLQWNGTAWINSGTVWDSIAEHYARLDDVEDSIAQHRAELNELAAKDYWVWSDPDIYYNSGAVGIGVTSPSYLLHVGGDINTDGYLRTGKLGGDYNGRVSFTSQTGFTGYLGIDNSGAFTLTGTGFTSPPLYTSDAVLSGGLTVGTDVLVNGVDAVWDAYDIYEGGILTTSVRLSSTYGDISSLFTGTESIRLVGGACDGYIVTSLLVGYDNRDIFTYFVISGEPCSNDYESVEILSSPEVIGHVYADVVVVNDTIFFPDGTYQVTAATTGDTTEWVVVGSRITPKSGITRITTDSLSVGQTSASYLLDVNGQAAFGDASEYTQYIYTRNSSGSASWGVTGTSTVFKGIGSYPYFAYQSAIWGPAIHGVYGLTNPQFLPDVSSPTTGYGGDGNVLTVLIAGTRKLTIDATGLGIGTTSPSELLHVAGDARVDGHMMFEGSIAQFHRIDSINTVSADAWVSVKFDTLVGSESTYGYSFGADSTYFIVGEAATTRVQGCGHWKWQGAPNTSSKMYIRVTVNSVEARCLQANDVRGGQTSDDGTLPFTGTIAHAVGDTVRVQYRVASTDMDWVGAQVFDNPVAFSVNFEKISDTQ